MEDAYSIYAKIREKNPDDFEVLQEMRHLSQLIGRPEGTEIADNILSNPVELQARRKPDFLIVGTMKGGTTILYDFINMHPDVESASQKEIHYFSLNYHKRVEWYLSHFTERS